MPPWPLSPERPAPGLRLPFEDGAVPAQLGPPAGLARLLVILALAQLLLQAAPLQQFLETAQGRADRLALVDPHPQRHARSFGSPARRMKKAPGRGSLEQQRRGPR